MKSFQRLIRYPEVWVLTVVAFATRFWQLDTPHALVFDEVYFRTFPSDYLSGHYFFDIHPPLVKLFFAGIGALAHLTAAQVASGDPGGFVLRIAPALAGVLLVPLMYAILQQLGLGRRIATLGALFILLDNALLVESRFVLMDSILLLAGMSALSCYLAVRRRSGRARWLWLIGLAVSLGVLVSTKWTGLAVAGLLTVAWLVEGALHRIHWRRMLTEGLATLAIIAAIYIGSFMVHFALLTRSGDGDAFMSPQFQSTLVGSPYYNDQAHMSFLDKFIELNKEMYTAQKTLDGTTHPYGSRWYSWPLMIRPIYYWEGPTLPSGAQGNIYLLGNPAVWWLSAVGVVSALLIWLAKPKWLGHRRKLVAFLLTGYALNVVPFAFIDRPMFLYHYLFGLLFSIIATCVMIGLFFDWQQKRYGAKSVHQTYWAIVIVILLGFLYFLPLSYGWPLSPADLQQHIWLPTWR